MERHQELGLTCCSTIIIFSSACGHWGNWETSTARTLNIRSERRFSGLVLRQWVTFGGNKYHNFLPTMLVDQEYEESKHMRISFSSLFFALIRLRRYLQTSVWSGVNVPATPA